MHYDGNSAIRRLFQLAGGDIAARPINGSQRIPSAMKKQQRLEAKGISPRPSVMARTGGGEWDGEGGEVGISKQKVIPRGRGAFNYLNRLMTKRPQINNLARLITFFSFSKAVFTFIG